MLLGSHLFGRLESVTVLLEALVVLLETAMLLFGKWPDWGGEVCGIDFWVFQALLDAYLAQGDASSEVCHGMDYA